MVTSASGVDAGRKEGVATSEIMDDPKEVAAAAEEGVKPSEGTAVEATDDAALATKEDKDADAIPVAFFSHATPLFHGACSLTGEGRTSNEGEEQARMHGGARNDACVE